MTASRAPMPRILSYLLLSGVVISLALMGSGYLLLLIQHGMVQAAWMPLGEIIPRALAGDARGILDLGVLALLITPTLRVIASIVLFAADRRPRYALIATGVLLLLALSFTIAVLRQ